MKKQFDPLFMLCSIQHQAKSISLDALFLEKALAHYQPKQIIKVLPLSIKEFINSEFQNQEFKNDAAMFLQNLQKNFLKKLPKKVLQIQTLEQQIFQEREKRQKIQEKPQAEQYPCQCGKEYSTQHGLNYHKANSTNKMCNQEPESELSQPQQPKRSRTNKQFSKNKKCNEEPERELSQPQQPKRPRKNKQIKKTNQKNNKNFFQQSD